MSALVKAGAVVGGLALTIGGGFYVKTLLGEEVLCIPLTKEDGYSETYGDNSTKIGKLYGNYLVAPYGLVPKTNNNNSGEVVENNKKWWEKTYEVFKKDNASSNDFKGKVSGAYDNRAVTASTETNKALNKICEGVYGKESTDIKVSTTGTESDQSKLRKDLFKYCSFLGEEPTTIDTTKEESYSDNESYGKKHETKLIGTKGNDIFWETRNKEFFGAKDENGIGHGLTENTDSLFHGLYATKGKSNQGNIRETCQKAYELKESGDVNKPTATKGNVFKFCSLEKKEVN
ncbi:hypothetical protein MHSWG343_09960 [Candidatus Mycoplasma haematohominis]|uniref:Uncharacterized protein n=1 Tax=Candidatus Mycoplasma haematohominis TaxID=1494318 RepID=A0A478FQY1_9MOLU|nr:hypothetical protein MHSWG343_09960 [Candidatus Mycoplasma haemohominis]